MAASSSSSKTNPPKLLSRIYKDYPSIRFCPANHSWWDPDQSTIYYDQGAKSVEWSILHELGHMLGSHQTYKTDLELLSMELEAWDTAKELATKYNIALDKDHIEDCMDSYREWLHKRSACPKCHQTGLQDTSRQYRCPNCNSSWLVSGSRFCRVYRKNKVHHKT